MPDEQLQSPTPQATQPSASQPAESTVKSLCGFDDGQVLPDGEVVHGSYDEAGKLIGWHKELGGNK